MAANRQGKPEPTVNVGDLVLWEVGGIIQSEPLRVREIHGAWLLVEGSNTGIPAAEVTVIESREQASDVAKEPEPGSLAETDGLAPRTYREFPSPRAEEAARKLPAREVTSEAILQALDAAGGGRTATASTLGISIQTLRRRLRADVELRQRWDQTIERYDTGPARIPRERPKPKWLRVCTGTERDEYIAAIRAAPMWTGKGG